MSNIVVLAAISAVCLPPKPVSTAMTKRNHRIRSGHGYDEAEKKRLHGLEIMDDVHQMATVQILDKMHCFFLHSYDWGHRRRRSECDEEEKNEVLVIGGTRRRRMQRGTTKFTLNMEQKKEEILYSFGHPYWYWDEQKLEEHDEHREEALCIPMKYPSLKTELLQNEIACIDQASWIELVVISNFNRILTMFPFSF